MNFTHYDLGFQKEGAVVEVHLSGTECNVFLLDNNNFYNYRNGRQYRYYGGHTTQSIRSLTIPYSGHWNIAIDLGEYRGQVTSSVRVI